MQMIRFKCIENCDGECEILMNKSFTYCDIGMLRRFQCFSHPSTAEFEAVALEDAD